MKVAIPKLPFNLCVDDDALNNPDIQYSLRVWAQREKLAV